MSPVTVNGSSSCCIGGDPPSPTDLAPRPVNSPNKLGKKVTKNAIPSWSTGEAAELQAIFEDNMDPTQKIDRVKPPDSLALNVFLESEEGKSDPEENFTKIATKKSSSTLKAVTEKLKKHLSRESALNKRFSRSSVGTSEEEVERRAELRRIRERRIREELSNEGIYDADAKSISSVADVNTPLQNDRPSSWILGHFPPALTPPNPINSVITLLDSDSIRRQKEALAAFRNDSPSPKYSRPRSNPIASTDTLVGSTGTLSRRHSLPIISQADIESSYPKGYVVSRKRSSLPPIPPAPILQAQRLPSIPEPTRSSWRLSFASEKRGEQLRRLSQEHFILGTLERSNLSPNVRPMSRWLHSQGLRVSSQAIANSEDDPLSSLVLPACPCSTNEDLGGVDGVEDGSLRLQETETPKSLSRRILQSSTDSPRASSLGSHQRWPSSISGTSWALRSERARYLRNTSDSFPMGHRQSLRSSATVAEEASSSFYPTKDNSIQPSPINSRLSLLFKLKSSKSKSTLEDIRTPQSYTASASLSNVDTAKLSSSDFNLPLARYNHRTTMDDGSAVISDTASFRQREAELDLMHTRFIPVPGTPTPSTPRSSRFREEFDAETEPEPEKQLESRNRKQSVFARLARIGTRTYDGTDNMEELLDIPLPKFNPEVAINSKSHGIDPFGDSDEAENAWGKALKQRVDPKANEVANNLKIPGKKTRFNSRKKSIISEDPGTKSAFSVFGGLTKGKKKKAEQKSAAEEYEERFQERLAVKELVMDSWEAEMEATASKAKAKSKNIVLKSKPLVPDRRYPPSWSKFPSHDRHERMASAAIIDRVEVNDFAKLGLEQGEIVWCLAHDEDGHQSVIDDVNKKKRLKERVGEAAAHFVYKSQTADDQSAQTRGRRGSLTVASELEYPELEILPLTTVTMKSHEELAADIHAEDRKKEEDEKLQELRAMGLIDGSLDEEEKTLTRINMISIADPEFYEDCIFQPGIEENIDALSGLKRSKFRTWSGKDWNHFKQAKMVKTRCSMDIMGTRRSTDEYLFEVKEMERLDREKVLKAVEEAWGKERG